MDTTTNWKKITSLYMQLDNFMFMFKQCAMKNQRLSILFCVPQIWDSCRFPQKLIQSITTGCGIKERPESKKIDNLRIEHEQLGTRLHELQMDDGQAENAIKKSMGNWSGELLAGIFYLIGF